MFAGMKFSPTFEETQVQKQQGGKNSVSATKRGSTKRPANGDAKGTKKRRVQSRRPRPENTHTGRWTKEEHEKFLEGINVYGKEWKKIASMIETRTVVQIRTHAQKYFQKLAKKRNQEMKHAETASSRPSGSKSKKTSRKSQKGVRSSGSSSSVSKKGSSIPFKVSLNLSLQLPSQDTSKSNHRENSPTSVADLGTLSFLSGCSFGSDYGLSSVLQDEQEIPLSNWLNDVKMDSDSSDSCSLDSVGHDTVYVDTRFGLEGNLESYDFDAEAMFSPSFVY